MNEELRALAATAAGQHGVIGRQQATLSGVDRWAIQRGVDGGQLVPMGRRAWRFAGAAVTWRGRLQAGLLDLGDQAVVGGRSAAALLQLDGFTEGPLDFVIPRAQRGRTTSGSVHSIGPVAPIDRSIVDGLACTSAALTVIHLAGMVGRRETANALDSAVRLRLLSAEFLERRFSARRGRGTPGATLLEELLHEAGVESWLERRFLGLLRAAGLPRPSLQRVHRRDGRHIARVDFDFSPWPVVVEVGGQKGYLSTRERQRQDRRRNALQLTGKIAYFFSYDDVVLEPGYVAGTVRSALAATARAAS